MFKRRRPQCLGIAAMLIGVSALTLVGTDATSAGSAPAALSGHVPQAAVIIAEELSDPAKPTLSRLDLAVMQVDYLFLDEVVAGRGGAMTSEVEMAIARLDFLLLPEVKAFAE